MRCSCSLLLRSVNFMNLLKLKKIFLIEVINTFVAKRSQYCTFGQNFDSKIRNHHQKNFSWVPRLWVGRWLEPILFYLSKTDEMKNFWVELLQIRKSIIISRCSKICYFLNGIKYVSHLWFLMSQVAKKVRLITSHIGEKFKFLFLSCFIMQWWK